MLTKENSKIKVMIVDDHQLFRDGIKVLLSSYNDIEIIGEAENGLQLLKILENKLVPDIIMLDINMPEMDGLSTLPEIKKMYPEIRVIILTMYTEHSTISTMMELGANAYLSKDTATEDVYMAIKTVYNDSYFFNETVNKVLLSRIVRKKEFRPYSQDAQFTEKEMAVLKLICEEKTINEIGQIIFLSPRTVESIRARLLEKTGTKSTAGLAIYAAKAGLLENP